MGFVAAIESGFRQYFKFSGRASRSEFWYWVLFMVSTGILLKMLDKSIFDAPVMGITLYPISDSFAWLTLFPFLALTWRRVHDTGRSGWWVGFGFLWMVFWLVFSVVMAVVVLGAVDAGQINATNAHKFKLLSSFLKGAPYVILTVECIWLAVIFIVCCLDTKSGVNAYGKDLKYDLGTAVFN